MPASGYNRPSDHRNLHDPQGLRMEQDFQKVQVHRNVVVGVDGVAVHRVVHLMPMDWVAAAGILCMPLYLPIQSVNWMFHELIRIPFTHNWPFNVCTNAKWA